MRNPFRRQIETAAPSLRERAADLRARLIGTTHEPEAAPKAGQDPEGTATVEDFAALDFAAYTLDGPVKTPTEWANQFISPAMAMHVADRTLRMTKPELIAFIRDAGEGNAAAPEIMFRNLDASQETLEGWSNLLATARARYIVAASAACLEPPASSGTESTPSAKPPANTGSEPASVNLLAAAGLNLSRLSLRDVAALHDLISTLANVVRAMQMQPRGWAGPHLNDVGKFTDWLGDQFDAQIDATVRELRGRKPADWIERDIRLEAIAEATVSNGDRLHTVAFARELLASVEK